MPQQETVQVCTHTFGDFEFVVLLVPEAALIAGGYPDGEVCVRVVGGLQVEIGG